MKGFGYERSGRSKSRKFGLFLSLPFVVLIIAYALYKLFLVPDPVIEGMEEFRNLPLSKTVSLSGDNIRSITVTISQEGGKVEILKDMPDVARKVYEIEVKPGDYGLKEGPAKVTVKASSGILKEITHEISALVDTVPPVIDVISAPSVVDRGSGGFAVLRARDADSVYVTLEGTRFRAFQTDKDGEGKSKTAGKRRAADYFAFFPVPLEEGEKNVYYAVAEDRAGNRAVRPLRTRLRTKTYDQSSITIDDSFIGTVISPLLGEMDIPDPAGAFRKVNEEWRADSLARLKEISLETHDSILWNGRFLQLRNSKVMATYGDMRTYLYNGKPVSRGVHLGYDLASIAQAPVEASNDGIVRFTGDIGIYGKTIIIDHGLGVMSLYGHLSSILISEGEKVEKGDIIGRTGSTGLAGGDHLHFGILIHGYEVSPLYWWDSQWLKTAILDQLENAY
jgi:murein DD-endopeptidase MepM/ murein hydrolase activator NlpD